MLTIQAHSLFPGTLFVMPIPTKPEVFIVESLAIEDEKHERYEGKVISQILALGGKTCEYYYIRTKRELTRILDLFDESKYRYLHLSCHGNENGKMMHTTLDTIPFTELGPILRPHLRGRRLFVSACSMTNAALAKKLMPDSGCTSILGPNENISFKDAAILWASLYHVLLSSGAPSISQDVLEAKAQEVANMYRVHLTCIARAREMEQGYRIKQIIPTHDKATGHRVHGKLQLG
jgi:hypothetical protein